MTPSPPSITVVVPVFNGAASLPELCSGLAEVLPGVAPLFEVILVDDGSRDGSWQTVQRLAREYAWLRGVSLMRNFGQHNALLCGVMRAQCEVIVTMDDDLQHRVTDLPSLLSKLSEGYDVVYGYSEGRHREAWRSLGSQTVRWALAATMGIENAKHVSAFRAFRSCLRPVFAQYHSPHVSIDVLLSWATTRVTAVKVGYSPRRHGPSNYSLAALVATGFNMLTGYSTWPLHFASILGFASTIFGMGVLAYVVGRYFALGHSVPGFPFLASIIAIFAGVQLFALGIIGEYLARVFYRTMDRPTYVVREQTELASANRDD